MKTAEVAIEHVLAGLLALCAFVLPFLSDIGAEVGSLSTESLVGILGLGYLLGVVFDKVADTILGPFEQLMRLKVALGSIKKETESDETDPFPQDRLEYSLRKEKNGRLEWMESLRSRIRTSRALAVLGAPAALGVSIYLSRLPSEAASSSVVGWCLAHVDGVAPGADSAGGSTVHAALGSEVPYAYVLVNLVLLGAALLLAHGKVVRGKALQLPRTDELGSDKSKAEEKIENAELKALVATLPYLLLFAVPVAAAWMSGQGRSPRPASTFLGLFGIFAGLLGLWSWSRITGTYLSFVRRAMAESDAE